MPHPDDADTSRLSDDAFQGLETRSLSDLTDRFRSILARLPDTTDVQALTAQLAATEARLQQKTDFLAVMSHEIRTPLIAVLGFARLLNATRLTAVQSTYAQKIEASGQHLLRVVDSTLDLLKADAGALRAEVVPCAVRPLIDLALDTVTDRAHRKGLHLHCQIAADVPDTVYGDPLRIGQILINFLANATTFTAAGSVRLEVTREGATGLRLAVADTGIGLTADQAARLFQPFTQADPSTARHYGGTGLGLAICRQLATLMGGEVGVNSTPGQGSTFWLILPRALSQPETQPVPAPGLVIDPAQTDLPGNALRFAGAQVLVVEDNPVTLELSIAMLRRLGVRADAAQSGTEAVQMAEAKRYDLILMDSQLPGMDGFQATRAIRALPSPNGIAIIIGMTAFPDPQDSAKARSAGMNDYVGKAVSPLTLRELLLLLP